MPDDPKPEDKPGDDPDAGAKKALEAERKARREAEQKAKKAEETAASLQKQIDDLADGKKGGDEKLREQLEAVQKNLDDERVMRLKAEVAADKGLTRAQAKRLSGSTLEELEEDADDLLEAFPAPAPAADGGDAQQQDGGTGGQQQRPPTQRPQERLKPGTGTGGDDKPDPTLDVKKLGAAMFGDA